MDDRRNISFVAPVRLLNLIWVFVLAGGWAAVLIWGTPHLRVHWEANGHYGNPYYLLCRYWGLHSFQIRPPNGRCPAILLSRKREG